MNFKNKFHLTLVVLITLFNSVIGISHVDTANALTVEPAVAGYNLKVYNQNISNIYNNINIKYISIRLYTIYNNIYINNKKVKLSSLLSFKEKVEVVMYSVKQVESNGRYNDKSIYSSACGAYQYQPMSWDNYQNYKNACLAPVSVQDSRMRGEVKYLWNKYHDWEKVIASHYMPTYAGNKTLWNKHYFAGQPTIREYVQNVETTMNNVLSGLATT